MVWEGRNKAESWGKHALQIFFQENAMESGLCYQHGMLGQVFPTLHEDIWMAA